MLSCIVGQLHAFAPFLVDVHLALRQFHYDVGGLESGIIRQIGADAEGAADFAPAMLLDVECLAKSSALLKTMVLVVGSMPSSR